MRLTISTGLVLCGLLAACASPGVSPEALTLEGRVSSGGGGRQVAATMETIASGATVSLIDPDTGNTLATTLTTPSGSFHLKFSNDFRPTQGPYVLEAIKGGKAGSTVTRVRTLVSRQSDGWRSLSGSGVLISGSSTAVAILASLKGLDAQQELALMGCITPGLPSSQDAIACPDTFRPTSGLTHPTFFQAYDLVVRALELDADPVASLFTRASDAFTAGSASASAGVGVYDGLGMAQDGWAVTSLTPSTANAASPTTLTVRGIGLPTATDSLQVTLNGTPCQVMAASPSGTQFTVKVPAGLVAGNTHPLVITYGPWIDRSQTVTIQ
ncbi:IPT/TIG domain-containing protein [bacterium]|nr:IPT/TIG domain-containing protein [bacterium]